MKLNGIVLGVFALFLKFQSSEANGYFNPVKLGNEFPIPFGDNDILRGFKGHTAENESPFKSKVFNGQIKTRAFATEFIDSSVIKDVEDLKDYLSVGGELSIKYGKISATGGGKFVSNLVSTPKELNIVYSRKSSAYTKFVDLETIGDSVGLSNLCGGPCDPTNMQPITDKFGDKFIDQVVYGAQLDIFYKLTSNEDIDYMLANAYIKGSIDMGVGGDGVEFSAEATFTENTISENYNLTITASAIGVNFQVPSNPTFEEANEIIAKFNEEYSDVLTGLAAYETVDEQLNVLKKLTPIGFTTLSISDYLSAMDREVIKILNRKLRMMEWTFLDSMWKKEKLYKTMKDEEGLRAVDDPRYRERRFVPFRTGVYQMIEFLDNLIQECLDYRALPLLNITQTDPPVAIGEREDSTLEKTYYGLIGMGYVPAPMTIDTLGGIEATYDDLYYTGFALPVAESEEFTLKPYFSGVVFDDNTDEVVTRGTTTQEIYGYLKEIISPSGLPPTSIGYLTSFVMSLSPYTNSSGIEHNTTYYATQFNEVETAFYPTTNISYCELSRESAQLKMVHKPEDLYDQEGIERGPSRCAKFGDVVYLSIGFLTSGDIFLRSKENRMVGSPYARELEFANPMLEGAEEEAFQWKIQSTIPFNKNVSLPDPREGECINIGDPEDYNVMFQNMAYDQNWITGGRGPQDERAGIHADSIFQEKKPLGFTHVYYWQIANYQKARTDMDCVELPEYDDESGPP